MAGPNSMPVNDRAEHKRLMQKICVTPQHIVHLGKGKSTHRPDWKNECVLVTNREYLLGRNRLRTGKTRG